MRVIRRLRRNIRAISLQFVITKIVVVSSGMSLVHPALENTKLANYQDKVIATVMLIEI